MFKVIAPPFAITISGTLWFDKIISLGCESFLYIFKAICSRYFWLMFLKNGKFSNIFLLICFLKSSKRLVGSLLTKFYSSSILYSFNIFTYSFIWFITLSLIYFVISKLSCILVNIFIFVSWLSSKELIFLMIVPTVLML